MRCEDRGLKDEGIHRLDEVGTERTAAAFKSAILSSFLASGITSYIKYVAMSIGPAWRACSDQRTSKPAASRASLI